MKQLLISNLYNFRIYFCSVSNKKHNYFIFLCFTQVKSMTTYISLYRQYHSCEGTFYCVREKKRRILLVPSQLLEVVVQSDLYFNFGSYFTRTSQLQTILKKITLLQIMRLTVFLGSYLVVNMGTSVLHLIHLQSDYSPSSDAKNYTYPLCVHQ